MPEGSPVHETILNDLDRFLTESRTACHVTPHAIYWGLTKVNAEVTADLALKKGRAALHRPTSHLPYHHRARSFVRAYDRAAGMSGELGRLGLGQRMQLQSRLQRHHLPDPGDVKMVWGGGDLWGAGGKRCKMVLT